MPLQNPAQGLPFCKGLKRPFSLEVATSRKLVLRPRVTACGEPGWI